MSKLPKSLSIPIHDYLISLLELYIAYLWDEDESLENTEEKIEKALLQDSSIYQLQTDLMLSSTGDHPSIEGYDQIESFVENLSLQEELRDSVWSFALYRFFAEKAVTFNECSREMTLPEIEKVIQETIDFFSRAFSKPLSSSLCTRFRATLLRRIGVSPLKGEI